MQKYRLLPSRPLLNLLTLAREIAADAAAQPDPDRSLRTLRSGLLRLGFKRAGVCIIDPVDALRLLGTWGTDFHGREIDEHDMVLLVGRYIADGLISPFEKIATCRLAQPPNLSLPHDSQLPHIDGPPNSAVVALRADGELLGIIQVDMLPGDDILDEPRLAVLEFLADQVAVIIARGRSEARLQQANAVLERERATLHAIRESMVCGFIMIDPNRRITHCNDSAASLLGIRPDDIIGQPDEVAFRSLRDSWSEPRPSWNAWNEVVTTLLAEVSNRRYEFNFVGYQQQEVSSQVYQITSAGVLLGIGLMLRDVTALKHVALLRERERIAMDLHDGVIQTLYAAALRLDAAKIPTTHDPNGQIVAGALDLIDDAIRSIRKYVSNLDERRPGSPGLRSGLQILADEVSTATSLQPSVEIDTTVDATLPSESVGHVLHIAHEAAINVVRHAGAREVIIRLTHVAQTLVLTVVDDGCGFDPSGLADGSGHGLHNMARRADLLGGRLRVTSQRGRGTEVRLEVPLAM